MSAPLAVMAALVAFAGLAACATDTAPAAPTAKVARAEIADRIVLAGALHATNALELIVPTTDESQLAIRWIAQNGMNVHSGDRVVELDGTPFADRVRSARVQIASATAQLALARRASAIQLHDKEFAVRTRELEVAKARLQAEVPADLMSARAAQDIALRLVQAEDDLRRAKQDLESSRGQLALEDKIKSLDLDRQSRALASDEHALSTLVLTAPRDGIVVLADNPGMNRTYRPADMASAGQLVATLPSPDAPMDVHAELVDIDDGRVAPGMRGTCTLDAYPAEPLGCSVVAVSPVARHSDGHDSLRRAFDVTLALAPAAGPAAHLRPGMSVKVDVSRAKQTGLAIPRVALVVAPLGRGAMVALASGELRAIEIGACDASRCVVERGLVEGDEVALAGPAPLEIADAPPVMKAVEVEGELVATDTEEVKAPKLREVYSFKLAWLAEDGADVAAGDAIAKLDASELTRSLEGLTNDSAELEQREKKRREEVALARREDELRVMQAEATAKRSAMKLEVPPELTAALELRAMKLDDELAKISLVQAKEAAAFSASSDAADLADLAAQRTALALRIADVRANLDHLTVTAPRAGTVVVEVNGSDKRKVDDTVYPTDIIARVVSLSSMSGSALVDETDVGRIAPGASVALRLDALPDLRLTGSLAEVTTEVTGSTRGKQVRVKLALAPVKGAGLRPGMRFHGELEVAR